MNYHFNLQSQNEHHKLWSVGFLYNEKKQNKIDIIQLKMFRVNENIYKRHVALIRVLRQLVSYQTNETCDVFFQKSYFFFFFF